VRPILIVLLAGCVPNAPAVEDAGQAADAATIDAESDAGEDAGFDAETTEDTGAAEDSGASEDAGVPDTGAPSHCPLDPGAACSSPAACGTDIPPPSNCDTCVISSFALCVSGACETPPPLDIADIYAIATQVDPNVPLLESIASFAVAARTAGDAIITCEDIYAGRIDLSDRCYNVLESESTNVSQTGDTYTVSFNGFTSGQRTLFILFGHESTGARGEPVGLSCTEIDVGPPMGGMSQFFAGDRMRAL
jgi:hypothetical protein